MSVTDLLNNALSLHQAREWPDAKKAYLAVLEKEGGNTAALVNLGAVHRQLNDIESSIACYKKAIEFVPNSLEAWFNYGNLSVAINDYRQAIACFAQVLELSSVESTQKTSQTYSAQARYQLASCYKELGEWSVCREHLEALLKEAPENASALLELGNCWQHLGDRKQALNCYLALEKVSPEQWKPHYCLARWYDTDNDKEQCQRHLTLALHYAQTPWLVHYSLAQSRFDLGRFDGAHEQYLLSLKLNPNHPSAKISLGACLMHLQQQAKAQTLFESVSHSDDVGVLSELARVIWEYKFFQQAIEILKKMVRLRPDLPDTHMNLAKAYFQNWNMGKSRDAIEQVLNLNSDHREAQDLLADLNLREGKSDACLPIYQQRIERDGHMSASVSSYLFTELYSPTVSAKTKALNHIKYAGEWVSQLHSPPEFTQSMSTDRPLRIGFVSADFRDQHPVGIFVQAVFAHYNKQAFRFYGYYTSRTFDDSTYKIKDMLDQWVNAAAWSDERLRSQILDDQIDILIDLSGHTAKHRLRMFAMRAAPVQVTWMGYPHSTGLSEMDYMIADPIVCPPENDHLCSEQVIRLQKHCVFCLPPNDTFDQFDERPETPNSQLVFGSFNNLTKVNDATLQLWLDVLKAVPDSLLKLKTPSFTDPQCRRNFIAYFVNEGIAEERLIFTGPSSLEDMMREYKQVDIALDTIPYNGGTTTFQALWMGVPVLALEGDNFCGRMGASFMTHLGLDNWVAKTREEYIKKAKHFAEDKESLMELKYDLRQRMLASPLCDTQGFTSEFEGILTQLWQTTCAESCASKNIENSK